MADRPKTAQEAFEGWQQTGGLPGSNTQKGSVGQYWDPMDQAMRGVSGYDSPEAVLSHIQRRYGEGASKAPAPVATTPSTAAPVDVAPVAAAPGGGDVADVPAPSPPSMQGLQSAAGGGDSGDGTTELTPPSIRQGIGTRILPQESMALAGLKRAY